MRQGEAALPGVAGRSAALARILPFATYIGFLALGQLLTSLFPARDLRWLYAVQIVAVLVMLAAFARRYVELADREGLSARAWWQAFGLGVVVFVLWINLDLPWAGGGAGAGFDATAGDGSPDLMLVALRLVGAVAVVPVMEELFWRSFVLRWVAASDFLRTQPSAAGWRALLVSSVLFGVEHELWLAGIVAGLGYGWLYMRSGNLWLPIAAHATTNLLLGVWVVATASWRFW